MVPPVAEGRSVLWSKGGVVACQILDGRAGIGVDGPARAIRAAHAVRAELTEHGLAVRVGLHTGEVELVGDDTGGIAVHIAARAMAQAGAGEILCSRTVKDLVAGAGFAFEDRGTRRLKDIADRRRLYAVQLAER